LGWESPSELDRGAPDAVLRARSGVAPTALRVGP